MENTYADPVYRIVPQRPDHHRVAVDRDAVAEPSSAAPSPAVSLSTCVQLEVRSPAVSRVNTYADPLLDPLSSSFHAPITTVSPSIETL